VTLGIPLLKVIGRDSATLLGAGDTAPIGNGSTLYIRINVSIFSPSKLAHILFRDRITEALF
jgi:hypothetical protein